MREFPADRKRIDIGDYYSDFSKGYERPRDGQPKVPLVDGLKRTVAFFAERLPFYC